MIAVTLRILTPEQQLMVITVLVGGIILFWIGFTWAWFNTRRRK